ncbi:MAG: sulfotransferase [Proteobacteria bacterium]|nr:sulfotransferase [Pseudomonadota bacterium]
MNQPVQELLRNATAALNTGALRELHSLCQQILNIDDTQADAWFFMSIVAEAGRQIGQSIGFIDRALALDKSNSEYLAQKAKCHTLLNQFEKAVAAADQASALHPRQAIVLDTLGVVYSKMGEHAKARSVLAESVEREPLNQQYQFNLASAEQFLGNESAAKQAYEAAIRIAPDFARAHWALSELEKNQTDTTRFEALKNLTSQAGLSVEDELYLCHALSREYEKLGDFDNAFAYLKRGKQRRKASIGYSAAQDASLFEAIRATFTQAKSPAAQSPGEQAIFILGMPRSGTTVVERIVAAHSQVVSLGELQEFARAVKAVSGTDSPTVLDPEVIAAAAQVDPTEIGQLYLRMLGERIASEQRFIDKMPLNFLCIGFILESLPGARIICLRRHPLDTCLSNYRQLFALNFSYYNYHYDLSDTAHFYVQFDRLMSHWKSLYGNRIHETSYEELVADPETHVRSLLDYLDLPWQAQCLEFHKSKEAVATASAMQVRQPLYNSSIGRWRKYTQQLGPAIEILSANGIDIS